MALIGSRVAGTWYKPYEEDDAEYLVAPLTNSQYTNIIARLSHDGLSIDGDGLMQAFVDGVRDWKKVFTADGKEAPLGRQSVEYLERKHFLRVANRVIDISHMGLEESKN